jgi:hypothetical protein
VLTNRGSEFCGNHEYDIDYSRSKTKSPQTRPATGFFEQKRAARGRRRKEKDAIGAASRVSLARILFSNP